VVDNRTKNSSFFKAFHNLSVMTVLVTRTQSVACVRGEGLVKEQVSRVDERSVFETTENAVVCLHVC